MDSRSWLTFSLGSMALDRHGKLRRLPIARPRLPGQSTGRSPSRITVNFALHPAPREAEICRLEWRDNEAASRSGLVRDAKHPAHREGNHRRFKYTREARAIVERPRTGTCIFPCSPRSVSAAFTRTCHVLGIEDLRFHDLRHSCKLPTIGALRRATAAAGLPAQPPGSDPYFIF
jgi:integrase